MPFNLRHFEEETKARMGVVECVSHKMIEPFQVLYEKPSKFSISHSHSIFAWIIMHLLFLKTVHPDTMLDQN